MLPIKIKTNNDNSFQVHFSLAYYAEWARMCVVWAEKCSFERNALLNLQHIHIIIIITIKSKEKKRKENWLGKHIIEGEYIAKFLYIQSVFDFYKEREKKESYNIIYKYVDDSHMKLLAKRVFVVVVAFCLARKKSFEIEN